MSGGLQTLSGRENAFQHSYIRSVATEFYVFCDSQLKSVGTLSAVGRSLENDQIQLKSIGFHRFPLLFFGKSHNQISKIETIYIEIWVTLRAT